MYLCSLISTRKEEEVDHEEEEEKKKKKKMKKKKKPSSSGDHHHEEDDHEAVEWEDLDDHEILHGHNHGQANKDVLPVEEATGHADANANEDEVESGRSNGGG